VISSDEKTTIQARCRCHPSLPPGKSSMMRVEHDYDRGGALADLAAYDVHRARLFGRTEPTTGIEPFGRLVEQVTAVEPYASARRVFWVVDNASSHRGQASVNRLEGDWPNLRLIHLPIHASWLNQIEIVLSVIGRKVVTPNDFADLDQITDRLAAFEDRHHTVAEPFDWRFTRDDLARWTRAHRRSRPGRPGTAIRRPNRHSSQIHAEGSPRYRPQAQSSASSGLPPMTPVGRNDSS
jgi:transposase